MLVFLMQELKNASNAPVKEELTVDGAWHAATKAKEPQKYYHRVFEFDDRWTS